MANKKSVEELILSKEDRRGSHKSALAIGGDLVLFLQWQRSLSFKKSVSGCRCLEEIELLLRSIKVAMEHLVCQVDRYGIFTFTFV